MYTSIYPQSQALCSIELASYPFFVSLSLSLPLSKPALVREDKPFISYSVSITMRHFHLP